MSRVRAAGRVAGDAGRRADRPRRRARCRRPRWRSAPTTSSRPGPPIPRARSSIACGNNDHDIRIAISAGTSGTFANRTLKPGPRTCSTTCSTAGSRRCGATARAGRRRTSSTTRRTIKDVMLVVYGRITAGAGRRRRQLHRHGRGDAGDDRPSTAMCRSLRRRTPDRLRHAVRRSRRRLLPQFRLSA